MSYGFLDTGGKDLGPEEFRSVIWEDPNLQYEVDITDVGKYDGKWYIFNATGCSCWGGEYDIESGPFDTLADLRAHVDAEYGNDKVADYYKEITEGWSKFFSENPELV